MGNEIRCKLTGIIGPSVRAHIIPKSFYAIDHTEKIPLKIITNSDDGFNGKSFVGIYDKEILTRKGEQTFSEWDSYAYDLLVRDYSDFRIRHHRGEPVLIEQQSYSYQKLKLFFLSVLWRAAVSTQRFFSKVSLGPHEKTLQDMILDKNPGDADDFAVTVARFVDLDSARTVMLDPFAERYSGVNYYRLYLGTYVASIKVDRRPTPNDLRPSILAPSSPLRIVARQFEHSKEKAVMQMLVREHGD